MIKLNKFNQKSVSEGAIKAASTVGGMMAGGALENVMPESIQDQSNIILSVAGGTGAILLSDKTTMGTVAKYASLGVAARSLYSVISDQLQDSVPAVAEGEEESLVNKLARGAVGLSSPDPVSYLASPTINFDDYETVEPATQEQTSSGISILG